MLLQMNLNWLICKITRGPALYQNQMDDCLSFVMKIATTYLEEYDMNNISIKSVNDVVK